jgi:acyl dehydratase
MPINPSAVGTSFGPSTASWDASDALLYALGVGAGRDDLPFTTEHSTGFEQKVLPTFALVIGQVGRERARSPRGGNVHPLAAVGTFNPAMVVHAGSSVELPAPLPPTGTVEMTGKIAAIWDKGSGALVVLESEGRSQGSGDLVFRTTFSAFIRGAGGFGGDRGPTSSGQGSPDRAPDHVISYPTSPDQALLYRLSGDRNPLHSDPEFAKMAGFDNPIMHGLCTFGFTGRALLTSLCGSDPIRFLRMEGRFSKPVVPGDELTVDIWVDGTMATFRTRNHLGDVAIDQGTCRFSV